MRLLPENPPNISEQAVRRAWTVVGVLAVIVLVATVIGLVRLSDSNESLTDKVAELSKQADDDHAAAQALKEQVKRLGGKPVAEPGEPPAGPQGPGPTETQVKAAVADYCAGDRCKPTVSRSQVAEAVAAYCVSGICRGADGADGTDGVNGDNGTDGTDGATGPGPTPDQIADAVESYCADGKCRGEKGDTGDTGPAGKDATFTPSGMDCPEGERVNGVHLLADGSLTVSCAPLIGRE